MGVRYWTGNSGNWSDIAHWSATSGGVGGASVPISSDQVVVGVGGITMAGQTITLDQAVTVSTIAFGSDAIPDGFTFTTNNYNITTDTFSWYFGSGSVLNLGTSTVTTNSFSVQPVSSGDHDLVINGSNSTMVFPTTPYDSLFSTNTTPLGSITGTIGTMTVAAPTGSMNFWGGTNAPVLISNLTIAPGTVTRFVATTYVTNLTAHGTTLSPITFDGTNVALVGYISAANVSLAHVTPTNMTALGAAIPFDDSIGGINGGGNTNWCFTGTCSGNLSQSSVGFTSGETYHLSFDVTTTSSVSVYQGSALVVTTAVNGSHSVSFVADNSGDVLYFVPLRPGTVTIDNVRMKQVLQQAVDDNVPIKEFLVGNTDDGREIFFRADTQTIQMQNDPEIYSNPVAIATEMERGSATKVYVSLDDGQFYPLEGTATKGVSILKFNTPGTSTIKPPLAKTVQVSYRDSSRQLCRINQSTIISTPTPIDFSP